jgi:AcrR family transcriptional regulator
MGHREDLLAGAVRCLREKGYARTTARDIVAVSGTNLGSIGYHYGSTEALLNAAVMQAIGDFGDDLARAMATAVDPAATPLDRFEQYWRLVLDTFTANREVWLATFDVFSVGERVPQVRAALAEGLQDGRLGWARLLHGIDPEREPERAHAVGSIHQALLSGVLVQWLIDPDHAPSARQLAAGMAAIATDLTGERSQKTRQRHR